MAQPKILVVEDEVDAGELLARIFEVDDYLVLRARNGSDALDIVRSERPDIVLLDLQLPILDGRAFLHELRNDPAMKDTHVIVVSGASDAATCVGADAVIQKPLSIATLRGVLSAVHGHAPVRLPSPP